MNKKEFALNDTLSGTDIKIIRQKLKMTQQLFADFVNVSKKTVERWESSKQNINGTIVTLVTILNKYPNLMDELRIPDKTYPLRLWYMFKNEICSIIDVDEKNRKIVLHNFTNNYIFRAFGKNAEPSYDDFEEFLESRCFPNSRDKLKLILKDLDIPFYDPLLIVEKTQGRMAEDDFWIKIER